MIRITPLTPERWGDFERLFGPNGACAGCWCMWWRRPRGEFRRQGSAGNRAAFAALVAAGPPPGLLAYDDGAGDPAVDTADEPPAGGAAPVGWCAVGPRADLPGLDRSRLLRPVDRRPVWSISCFFVKAGRRRRGLGAALAGAAVDYARAAGAATLEAYPWDSAERRSAGTIYTGVASTFQRLGFVAVARRAPHRPIMRLELNEPG